MFMRRSVVTVFVTVVTVRIIAATAHISVAPVHNTAAIARITLHSFLRSATAPRSGKSAYAATVSARITRPTPTQNFLCSSTSRHTATVTCPHSKN